MLSIVIPVYNDEEVLRELCRRLVPVAETLSDRYEVVFVDDASTDNSWGVLEELYRHNPNIRIAQMARNFGQDGAMTAGLKLSVGDLVVVMDSDLQDRPEDIPKLVQALFDKDVGMAITRWRSRKDSLFRVSASRLLHTVTSRITHLRHQGGLGVFRAMRREVVDSLDQMPERTSSSLSQLYWLGFDYAVVDLDRDPRYAGQSGYTLGKMVKMSLDRILSYSILPIQVAIFLGLGLFAASILAAIYFVGQHFFTENVLPGWTSIIVAVLFLFGMNFLFLGIIGEYLGRVFLETKRRPKYVISRVLERRASNDGSRE